MTAHRILYGDSPFLVDEAVQQHIKTWQKPVEILPKNMSATDFLNTVQGVSLFSSGGTVYLWQDPDLLSSTGDDEAVSTCESALAAASMHGHHVLMVLKGNLDNRRKMTKAILTHATAEACMQFKEWEHEKWLSWVQHRLRAAFATPVSPTVAEALLATIGYDYGSLTQGVRNLRLYVGEKPPTTADVTACNAKGGASVFDLLEALRLGVTQKTLGLLRELLDAGEEPVAMIGLISSQWRLYLQILDGLQRKQSFAAMAKAIGRQPYYLEKLSGEVRRGYSVDKLISGLSLLHAADVAIKSGKQGAKEALLLALSRV
jgi:DNA polymerase-3 subunit delta